MYSDAVRSSPSVNSALEEAEPVICRIVRRKLHVTLRNDDGRENNLDALDVLGDIRLKLIRKLGQTEEPSIDDWPSYAATVAIAAGSVHAIVHHRLVRS